MNLQRTYTRGLTTIVVLTGALSTQSCGDKSGDKTNTGAKEGRLDQPKQPKDTKFFSIAADQTLTQPTGYREWVFVGVPVTPNAMNKGKAAFPEAHNVYIDPVSYAEYAETGKFRDGTILIKELTDIGATHASSGNGFFQGSFVGLEATIKSSKHFPDEPGNWAYYSFTNPEGGFLSSTAKPFPTASCNSCHDNSADDDFVFTQYYPVLRDAKNEKKATSSEPFTFANGVLQQPRGYRQWPFAGTPLTPNDLNNGKAAFPEFHNVYIDPTSYDHLKSTGEFRDGTILIKELTSVGSKTAVSGAGYFMGDFIGLEATIKSSKHFPDEPGNWAYFSFSDPTGGPPKATSKAFPSASCNSCHEGNADTDYVFTQYYPILRAAIAEAKGKPLRASNKWMPTAPHPDMIEKMPLDRVELHKWLNGGAYKKFAAKEKATHPGRGPHVSKGTPVRVFYNDILAKSLKASNAEHPKGSISVKEMFSADDKLMGWAVMAKLDAESNGGKSWYWYETTSISDDGAVPAAGTGVPGCIGCHGLVSKDQILSDWPMKH